MKLTGQRIQSEYTPLQLTGSLAITGGSAVQFYDGVSYSPNREGTPSAPIMITHSLSVINPDKDTFPITVIPSTLYYENDVPITASTAGYELVGNQLKVKKNIPAGSSVVIKAVSSFVDSRSGKTYSREDITYLRTILKTESQYQLQLSQKGAVFFDAYRNPNTQTTISARLMKGNTEITNLTGIMLKWLNSSGLDAVENELYADAVSADGKTLTIDKTYIDNELITCEAWQGGNLIAVENVTFIRKFNSFRTEISIPELPLQPGVNTLSCTIDVVDTLGNVDVDKAFLVNWIVSEAGVERQVATGASVQIPISSVNMKAANLMIFPDLKRREAFAAITTIVNNEEHLLTDDNDNVLTAETYGI